MNSNLLSIAIQAAIEAGRDIMAIYDDPAADFGIERKADNSPLTRADKAAHARIMSFLEPTGIPVLSEEGAHLPYEERRHWHLLWIVDPLDGTKEFIKRNGEFTVNIALVEDGTPTMGVIYVPVKQELYYGSAEQASPLTVPP
nr:3'(2'),5'-bisphosphate nucleotidase CysQ [Bacteroidaceae bacterium]